MPIRKDSDSELDDLEGETLSKKDASCSDLRILRNAYYAAYSYPFKSADLTEFFKKYDWYQPNPKFNVKKISAAESRELFYKVNIVKELEKKKGCKN